MDLHRHFLLFFLGVCAGCQQPRKKTRGRTQAHLLFGVMESRDVEAPPPRVARPPRRGCTTLSLAALLAFVALVTTIWTAAGLQPAGVMAGYRPAALLWSISPIDPVADEARYETVSEDLLLHQLVRYFLAAPSLLSDFRAKRRTWREPPVEGWAFPTQEIEEGMEVETEEEEEGVMLSESASALHRKHLQQLRAESRASLGAYGPSPADSWWSSESSEDGRPTDDFESTWDEGGAAQATDDDAYQARNDEAAAAAAAEEEEEARGVEAAKTHAQPHATASVSQSGREVGLEYLGPMDGATEQAWGEAGGADGAALPHGAALALTEDARDAWGAGSATLGVAAGSPIGATSAEPEGGGSGYHISSSAGNGTNGGGGGGRRGSTRGSS